MKDVEDFSSIEKIDENVNVNEIFLNESKISAIKGVEPIINDWKDLGIINVFVNDLPWPENINGPEDFTHNISWDDAKLASLQLPEVQAGVEGGKTGENFQKEDELAGLDWKNGKKSVFDLYYSQNDPVSLDKIGDTYSIINGRHRIFAAKQLGLSTIPARVFEKMRL